MPPKGHRTDYLPARATVLPRVRLGLLASFLLGVTVRAGATPPSATPWAKKPLVVLRPVPEPPRRSAPAPVADEAPGGFALVQSDEVIVRERGDKRAKRLGTLRRGAQIKVVARDDLRDCVDLAPRGTVCDASHHLSFEPRPELARASAPAEGTYVFARAGTPELFVGGAAGATFVPTRADFSFAKPRSRKGAFRVVSEVHSDTDRYLRTQSGRWLPRAAVELLAPSEFHGLVSAAGFDELPRLALRETTRIPRTRLDGECRALGRPCPARLLEVDAGDGTLLAHEDGRIVFATLVSVGKLGFEPLDGRERIDGGKTPLGVFSILGKHRSLTLTSEGSSAIFEDVPWTLHLTGPYAIHSAYWHDDFGQARSGGCVNVSPSDGAFLFEWTTPRVPPGWHSALRGVDDSEATVVWIHE